MSKAVAEKAKKYYPGQWTRAYLDALLKKGALTQDEYDAIISGDQPDDADEHPDH